MCPQSGDLGELPEQEMDTWQILQHLPNRPSCSVPPLVISVPAAHVPDGR